jgi:hypothetical protein
VLSRKQRAAPAVARIFDGEKEAKMIASQQIGAPHRIVPLPFTLIVVQRVTSAMPSA